MKNIVLFILAALLISACASPYQNQAIALKQACDRGEISPNEYVARLNQLKALDAQYQQEVAQSWQGVGQSIQAYSLQRACQPPIQAYQMPTGRNTYGTIYTPSGQMYMYNSTSY